MAVNTSDSKAPVRLVKRMQFGILGPDEIRYVKFTNPNRSGWCILLSRDGMHDIEYILRH